MTPGMAAKSEKEARRSGAPTSPSPQRVTVPRNDGLSLAGDLYGDADAPLIVLLHGGGQSRSAWRGAARRFAKEGLRAVTMDLRGHGDSDWSAETTYSFDSWVDDLVRTIDALGDQPAVVVGASLGGHVALIAAARHPERVRALALADVTPWIDETVGDIMRCGLRAAAAGFATLEEAAAMVDGLRDTAPRGNVSGLSNFLRTGEDGRLYWKWDPRFLSDATLRHGGSGGLFEAEARKLAIPVLVMRAEHSTITTPEQVATFRATVPWLQDVTIAGAGHMLTGDVNDAYADAVLAFVRAVIPGLDARSVTA